MPDSRGPAPFWLCHECHAQMRPVQIDGTPHCASCNSEFIEILDSEINPDPTQDLPPPPPVRPGQATSPAARPISPFGFAPPGLGPGGPSLSHQQQQGGNILESLIGGLFGGGGSSPNAAAQAGQRLGSTGSGDDDRDGSGSNRGGNTREWSFNFPGGGQGRVVFGTFNGPAVMQGFQPLPGFPGMPPRSGSEPTGLEGFLPGAFPGRPMNGGPTIRTVQGGDLLEILAQILHEATPQGNMSRGDYVYDDNSFNDVLEQLMHAAGPQGPIPASEVVIDGLPRKKLDEKSLESSPFKDCPVCKDDFVAGDEVVTVPCSHIFHTDCIQPWLRRNGSCPVCRFSLVPDEANRPPQGSNVGSGTVDADQGAQDGGGQGLFAGVLNRLFGQSGSANPTTPTGETPAQASAGGSTGSGLTASSDPQRPRGAATNEPDSRSNANTAPSASNAASQQSEDVPQGESTTDQSASQTGADSVHSGVSSQAPPADPEVPPLPTDIPAEYRELHRQRELRQQREAEARGQAPAADDLD